MIRNIRGFVAILACVVGNTVVAAPTSEDNVKFTVKADKPVNGKQVVTLTMEVANGWHAYANPVGPEAFASIQTTVTFTSGGKPVAAKIVYPEGKLVKDKDVGDYKTYEGTVTIKATIDRPPTGAVEASVLVQTCTETKCLPTAKIKLKVE